MATLTSFFSSGSGGGSTRSACIQDSFGTGAYEVFYNDGTFTVPSGVTDIRVKVYGAGGASGQIFGGSGGGFAMGCIGSLSGGDTFAVTVGKGAHLSLFSSEAMCCTISSGFGQRAVLTATDSNFGGGCICATSGKTQCFSGGGHYPITTDVNIACLCNYSHFCKCNCCRCTGGVGGGTCASVTYCGGAGMHLTNNCTSSTCSLCCSVCSNMFLSGHNGGGSGATQCGNGFPGFCYCRDFCCQRVRLSCIAVGGAGALGSNTYVHRCNIGRNMTSHPECCAGCHPCVADGYGVTPNNDQIQSNASSDSFTYPYGCTTNQCLTFVGQRFYRDYSVTKQQVSYDQPDQPVPGEWLHGSGGKTIMTSACGIGRNTAIGNGYPCATSTVLNCSTPMHQLRELQVTAKAGHGEPGAGGGALHISDCLHDQQTLTKGCCCCSYCNNASYELYAGNGGFSGGGGGVYFGTAIGPFCNTCNHKTRNSGYINTGRGGLGGGGAGGFHSCYRGVCNSAHNGWSFESQGGNGLIVVEY